MKNLDESFISEIKEMSNDDLLLIVADQKDLYSEDEMKAIYEELNERGVDSNISNINVKKLEANLNVDSDIDEVIENAIKNEQAEIEAREEAIAKQEEKYTQKVDKNTERYERLKAECTGESDRLYNSASIIVSVGGILAIIIVIGSIIMLFDNNSAVFFLGLIAAIIEFGISCFFAMVIRGIADIDVNSEISARMACETFEDKLDKK